MPINDNYSEEYVDELLRKAKEYGRQRAVNPDPTDLEYDPETGLFGPPKRPENMFAMKCDFCGEEMSLDDYANWVGTNTSAVCTPCKRKEQHLAQKAIEDLDDIDKMLAEMEDDDQ